MIRWLLKRWLLAVAVLIVLAFVLWINGCASSGSGGFSMFNPASWFSGGGSTTSPDPTHDHGEHAAAQLMKPLAWTGVLLVAVGFVWLLIARDFRPLLVAIGISLVPGIVMLVWKWAFLPVAIAVGIAGVMAVAWVAAHMWMKMQAKRRATKLRYMADNGGMTDVLKSQARLEADVLDHIGPRFKARAKFKELPV